MKRTKGWLITVCYGGRGEKLTDIKQHRNLKSFFFFICSHQLPVDGQETNSSLCHVCKLLDNSIFCCTWTLPAFSKWSRRVTNWFQPAVAMVSVQKGTTEEKGECESCDLRDILMSCDLGYSLITRKLWWEGCGLVLGLLWQLQHAIPVLLRTTFPLIVVFLFSYF